jgi:triphosphoribosyl-dephospho-CoA synthase
VTTFSIAFGSFICFRDRTPLNLAAQIEFACILEATVPKPGNVHPQVSFADLCYDDFVRAAHAVAEPLSAARTVGLGQAILNAARATREATGTNVNLGIILLLGPLAAVPEEVSLQAGIQAVLDCTTVQDSELVYTAIRLASPGGLGRASSQDVSDRPTINLTEAMCLAAHRDGIAKQYSNGFQQVFEARRQLCDVYDQFRDWNRAVIFLHVWMMSQFPDTLIARKCGREISDEATNRARALIDGAGESRSLDPEKLDEFDGWLRADGHRRNPGTTADLIAATLFCTFRDKMIDMPRLDDLLP